jgi:DNA-binding transcriptional LysR family regulator
MDLRQLRFFVEISESGGFTKAAEKLFIAQSALSTAIKKLEEELGVKLFSRRNKKIRLTHEGELLLKHAKEIFRSVAKAEQEIADVKNLVKGEVRVGLTPILSSFYFPHIIASFKREYPSMQVSVFCDSARSIQKMIQQGELDLGMVIGDVPDGLGSHYIIREEVVACVPRNHKFSGKRILKRHELFSQPLLLFKNGYFLRDVIDEAVRQEGIVADVAVESNLFSLLRSLVKEELGIAFLPRMAVANDSDVSAVSCDPQIFMNMSITWKESVELSLGNKVFIEFIKREIDEYYMMRQAATTFPLP